MDEATPRYHHGDLRAALCLAGYELAREGGSRAVTLRATTRRAGVSPPAAYRHFASHEELLMAVSVMAMHDLACAMERRMDAAGHPVAADSAVLHLEAVGLGYIDFALDSPGAFDVALSGLMTMDHAHDPGSSGTSGRTPYELLTDAVSALVVTGLIMPERADAVAILCWSTVHGFASLATTGPLREFPREDLDGLGFRLVKGLTRGILSSDHDTRPDVV